MFSASEMSLTEKEHTTQRQFFWTIYKKSKLGIKYISSRKPRCMVSARMLLFHFSLLHYLKSHQNKLSCKSIIKLKAN